MAVEPAAAAARLGAGGDGAAGGVGGGDDGGDGDGLLTVTELPLGVLLVRSAITPRDQRALLAEVTQGPADRLHSKAEALQRKPPLRYVQLATWNWPARYGGAVVDDVLPAAPAGVLAAAGRVLHAMQRHARGLPSWEDAPTIPSDMGADLRCPADFAADSLRVIGYPDGGCLPAHQDMFMGHTVSVSLGASCTFVYGSHYDADGGLANKCSVALASGDVMVFNGQRLPHAVQDVLPDTTPEWWGEGVAASGADVVRAAARINFQIRDCSSIARYGARGGS